MLFILYVLVVPITFSVSAARVYINFFSKVSEFLQKRSPKTCPVPLGYGREASLRSIDPDESAFFCNRGVFVECRNRVFTQLLFSDPSALQEEWLL